MEGGGTREALDHIIGKEDGQIPSTKDSQQQLQENGRNDFSEVLNGTLRQVPSLYLPHSNGKSNCHRYLHSKMQGNVVGRRVVRRLQSTVQSEVTDGSAHGIKFCSQRLHDTAAHQANHGCNTFKGKEMNVCKFSI